MIQKLFLSVCAVLSLGFSQTKDMPLTHDFHVTQSNWQVSGTFTSTYRTTYVFDAPEISDLRIEGPSALNLHTELAPTVLKLKRSSRPLNAKVYEVMVPVCDEHRNCFDLRFEVGTAREKKHTQWSTYLKEQFLHGRHYVPYLRISVEKSSFGLSEGSVSVLPKDRETLELHQTFFSMPSHLTENDLEFPTELSKRNQARNRFWGVGNQ